MATPPNSYYPPYLPVANAVEHKKGQLIYTQADAPSRLYFIVTGMVAVSCRSEEGKSVVLEIYRPLDFFGECAFLPSTYCPEEARAIADSYLMSWTSNEVEKQLSQTPNLALFLIQMIARRTADLKGRIETLCCEKVNTRITKMLLQLASRAGKKDDEDGSIRLVPLTHELIAQYVGCSREAVSMYLSQLRRMGLVRYSNREMSFNRNSLEELLRGNSKAIVDGAGH